MDVSAASSTPEDLRHYPPSYGITSANQIAQYSQRAGRKNVYTGNLVAAIHDTQEGELVARLTRLGVVVMVARRGEKVHQDVLLRTDMVIMLPPRKTREHLPVEKL